MRRPTSRILVSLNKPVHLKRIIDWGNDRYFEKVMYYETGKPIRECEEPLSQHIAHGSAKPKNS